MSSKALANFKRLCFVEARTEMNHDLMDQHLQFGDGINIPCEGETMVML